MEYPTIIFFTQLYRTFTRERYRIEDSNGGLSDVKESISHCSGNLRIVTKENFNAVITKNRGLETLDKIIKYYRNGDSYYLSNHTRTGLLLFAYMTVPSAEVGRVFSCDKDLLSDKRHALNEETIEVYLFLKFNKDRE